MKEHPLQIMKISDLIKFNKFVRKNHIKGRVIQNNLCSKANSFFGLALALPLDSAKLVIDDDSVHATNSINLDQLYA